MSSHPLSIFIYFLLSFFVFLVFLNRFPLQQCLINSLLQTRLLIHWYFTVLCSEEIRMFFIRTPAEG
jgi:hypothetical protein